MTVVPTSLKKKKRQIRHYMPSTVLHTFTHFMTQKLNWLTAQQRVVLFSNCARSLSSVFTEINLPPGPTDKFLSES